MILNRKSIIIILLCFIFISCSNNNKIINPTGLVDPSDSSGGSGGSGGGDTTELEVELVYTLDEQTKLFSTIWGAHQSTFIVHVPPNFNSNYSIPLLFQF